MQVPRRDTAAASRPEGEVDAPATRLWEAETPFITDPAAVSALDIPVEYVRRMEEAQRIYGQHYMEMLTHKNMWNHAALTVGVQCCWLGVGAWIVSRGRRFSDPMNSVVARWVQHSQLPYDVRLLRAASTSIKTETALMQKAMAERQLAYRDGQVAKEQLHAAEAEAFASGMNAK